jgi:hypothetical protein
MIPARFLPVVAAHIERVVDRGVPYVTPSSRNGAMGFSDLAQLVF